MMAAMWSYYWGVVIPAELAYAATTNSPRGNLSDLYPRWLGARELILHERDPYSTAMTCSGAFGVVPLTREVPVIRRMSRDLHTLSMSCSCWPRQ